MRCFVWCVLGGLVFAACKSSEPRAKAAPDAGAIAAAVDASAGCRSNDACAPDEYCAFSPELCGKGQKAGACRPRPAVCAAEYDPVCGCDGNHYESACAAHAAGVDLAVMGRCREAIPSYVACGKHYCDARTSYCEIFLSDVFDLPTDYFCRPLPPSCLPRDGAAQSCACFPKGTRCGTLCGPLPTSGGAMNGFHLTCQGTHPPSE